MKKVIYIDTASFNGHKQFNKNNINVLGRICNLDVFFRKDYLDYSSLFIQNVFESSLNCFPNYIKYKTRIGHFLKSFFGQLKILKEVLRIVKRNNYDVVIFSWVDIFPFWLKTKSLKNKIYFYEHGLYYTQNHKYTHFFWRHLNKNVCPIILEDYFSKYIRDVLKCKNKQYLIRHPLGKIDERSCLAEKSKSNILFFGPSQSNDYHFIRELYDYRNQIPKEVFIVVKGDFEYQSPNLLIYKDVLSREDYDSYMCNSSYILIPYSPNYNYRTSGVIFEGVACKKKIILLKGNTLQYLANKYRNLFILVDNIESLVKCLIELKDDNSKCNSFFDKDLEVFLNDYSDESLSNSFGDLLNDIPYIS